MNTVLPPVQDGTWIQTHPDARVALGCPSCRHQGIFEALGPDDIRVGAFILGQRRCPGPHCQAHVFVVVDDSSGTCWSYPPETIDFDDSNLPDTVRATIEEAVSCHATGCYVAAAMLVRKTLEALCEDQVAQGPNLRERLKSLRSTIVLPEALFDGLDNLRLLGNDAAHIES